jgi:hypothetical protein
MSNLPRVSIVILTHNRLDVTIECINSIKAHTTNYELIIVDNASSDDTLGWLKSNVATAKIVENAENLGIAKGRNQGLRLTTADYVVMMDNDIVVDEGWLEDLFVGIKRGFDIVGLEGWQLDSRHIAYHKCVAVNERFDYLGGACNLFKRIIFEKIGLLDENFSPAYYEDPDICIRAKREGYKLSWRPSPRIHHKEHATLIHGQKDFDARTALSKSHDYFCRKMAGTVSSVPELLPPVKNSLRILYCGMKWNYGKQDQGTSYEHDNFYPSLTQWSKTRSLEHFDFVELGQLHGIRRMSKMLMDKVQSFCPDVIFSVWFDALHDPDMEALSKIRHSTKTKVVSWFCDSVYRYETFDKLWAPHLDYCVVCSGSGARKYEKDGFGSKVIRSQFAVSPKYTPLEMVQDIDVSFVGQPHGKRKEVINYLQRRGVNIRAFGNGFETRLSFDQMVQMYCRSKINLNLSNTANSLSTQIKGRLFEVPACNAFLMTDIAEEMEKYYDLDTEVCTFSDPADLVEQIRFYLANPGLRNQIADAGYQRTIREHTYEHRFNDVFSKAGLL